MRTENDKLVDEDVDTGAFRNQKNMARVIDYARAPYKGVNPTKANFNTWDVDMNHIHARNFVKSSIMTENKNKKGEIEIHHSIFACSDEQLGILRQIERIRIDGTFKIIGAPFYQLVSIHGYVRHGHQRKSMPLGYIIMSGKTQKDYTDIFKEVKRVVELDGTTWNLKTAMLDFEIALRNSLKTVWPNIHLYGCWFHYCQAVWRRVQKLGLKDVYHSRFGSKFIKKLMLLPLFHANDDMIERVFGNLYRAFLRDSTQMAPNIAAAFEDLFSYVRKQWVYNPKIPATELSVFDTRVRTNNTSENWNGKTWKDAGYKAKPFYQLLAFLQNQRKSDVNILNMPADPKPDKKQEAKDKQIQDIWDQMKAKTIEPLAAMDALVNVCYRADWGYTHNEHMMEYTCDDIDEDIE